MIGIKIIIEAVYHLFAFKTYTTMPRFLEIGYGIVAWLLLFIVIYAQIIK